MSKPTRKGTNTAWKLNGKYLTNSDHVLAQYKSGDALIGVDYGQNDVEFEPSAFSRKREQLLRDLAVCDLILTEFAK